MPINFLGLGGGGGVCGFLRGGSTNFIFVGAGISLTNVLFVREFSSSRRQTPEVWNFYVFAVFEILFQLQRNGYGFFAYSWKLPAYSGPCLLTVRFRTPVPGTPGLNLRASPEP